MNKPSPIRLLLLLIALTLLIFLLLGGVLLTESLLNIRESLETAPIWTRLSAAGGFLVFFVVALWLLWRILRPSKKSRQPQQQPVKNYSEDEIRNKLESGRQQGLEVSEAQAELEQLRQRRSSGEIHIAFYGDVSMGKSSLVQALLPEQTIEIAPQSGTTTQLAQYQWQSPAGDRLVLTDMPGKNEVGELRQEATLEAQRAHIVVYVCDGDLTQTQWLDLTALVESAKPVIVVLNKSDRFTEHELLQVQQHLQSRLQALPIEQLVSVHAAYQQSCLIVDAGGKQHQQLRKVDADFSALQNSLQRVIDTRRELLDELRDAAVFQLVAQSLDRAESEQRLQKAHEITRGYARKAVIGAVAAITPGTDILIQGVLATRMVKELSDVYQVPARNVDIDLLLELVQQNIKGHMTLILALAGNALKAFPGVGTLTGGVLHAVAYGFLFEALGKSLAQSLDSRGELHPLQVADSFEQELGRNIKDSAIRFARIAIKATKDND